MKFKLFSVLLLLCAYVGSNAKDIFHEKVSISNSNVDRVASMTMDLAGNTYVLQNLANSTSGNLVRSISGYTSPTTIPDGNFSCMVVDMIPANGGAPVLVGVLKVNNTNYANSITGVSIGLDANEVIYVAGHFTGSFFAQYGLWGSSPFGRNVTSNGLSDIFVCSFNPTTTYITQLDQQGGTANEFVTSMFAFRPGGRLYVSGNYNETNLAETTSFVTTNGGVATTVPAFAPLATGQNNSYVLHYDVATVSTALTCTHAYGWLTLANANQSIIPHAVSGGGSYGYITGEFRNSVTVGPNTLTGATNCPLLYFARFDVNSYTYDWAFQRGASITTAGAKSSGNAIFVEWNSVTIVGSITEASSGPNHSGGSDVLYMRYATTSSSTLLPTIAFEMHSGGTGNDEGHSICNDGTGYVLSASMSNASSYTLRGTGSTTATYTGASGMNQGVILSYTVGGAINHFRYGQCSTIAPTAMAANQQCNISFGGNFNTIAPWSEGTIMGASSPTVPRLFAARLAARVFNISPVSDPYTLNNGSTVPVTVSGPAMSSYLYTVTPGPLVVLNSAPTSATTNITLVSGGAIGTSFLLELRGLYTYNNVSCTTLVYKTFRQDGTGKTDGSEVATSIIDDANTPMLTFNTYPNPVANQLTVSYSLINTEPAVIQAVDLMGRVVFEKEVNAQYADESVSTDLWSAGTYIVSLSQNGKVLSSKNVVKQ